MLTLTTPVSTLSQVGRTTASRLSKLGISTVRDLIFYYPFRYEDFSQLTPIGQLQAGQRATVRGKIELLDNRRSWKRKITLTEGIVTDQSGSIKVIWFNQGYLTKLLQPGDEVYLAGVVGVDTHDVSLVNPVYEKIKKVGETIHTARLVPVYSLTEGLTEKQIRWLISLALKAVGQLSDWLPEALRQEYGLVGLAEALTQIHFPADNQRLAAARRRLKFDELFLFLLQNQLTRRDLQQSMAPSVPFSEEKTKQFVSQLPFTLTDDQRKAAWRIVQDLEQPVPMNRLLEGDVGAGKTVVAALIALNVGLAGYQTVLMAPTEILAYQHFETFTTLLAETKLTVGLLTRTRQQLGRHIVTKTRLKAAIKAQTVDIIIGTHALIQEQASFTNVALVIIDEQHRFGVAQRKLLHDKSRHHNMVPHFLSMTATPIPRSLALTLYGDLDLSIIKQLPKERKAVKTVVVEPGQRQWCYDLIRREVAAGRQVFVICPLIDPSDRLGVKSVTDEYQKLRDSVFPNLRISMLHGRLKTGEKEQIMAAFKAGASDVVVSTSVVEVGVDVPNATVVMIESAERFGLAQLHQFRGRVGRSHHQSYCFLLTESSHQKTSERLQALVTAKDGFALAELDLQFRGPGELRGTNQSGWPTFRLASLFDHELISLAQAAAKKIMGVSPDLQLYPQLKQQMAQLESISHPE